MDEKRCGGSRPEGGEEGRPRGEAERSRGRAACLDTARAQAPGSRAAQSGCSVGLISRADGTSKTIWAAGRRRQASRPMLRHGLVCFSHVLPHREFAWQSANIGSCPSFPRSPILHSTQSKSLHVDSMAAIPLCGMLQESFWFLQGHRVTAAVICGLYGIILSYLCTVAICQRHVSSLVLVTRPQSRADRDWDRERVIRTCTYVPRLFTPVVQCLIIRIARLPLCNTSHVHTQ